MPTLRDFGLRDRVFIGEGGSFDWLGVEVLALDRESGQVQVRVVFTNDIPGYELDQVMWVDEGVLAYRSLTVDDAIEGKAGAAGQGAVDPKGHERLMHDLRDEARPHGWTVEWDCRGDQLGEGGVEYRLWFTPTGTE